MKYRRMPIEIESPEQLGYANIRCNLTESSVSDLRLADLGVDLGDLTLAYTDHRGRRDLRELIAAEGRDLTADDVLVTPGAAAALFIVATSLLTPSDRVVVMHPNYATNVETPRAIGCSVALLRLEFEQGFRFDATALRALLDRDTRLISLTTPHNPTGAAMTEADLRAAAALAEQSGAYLLVDETYRQMHFVEPTPVAASISPRCISVSSLSKAYGLPGIRIGWIITRDPQLQETFLAAKEQIVICNSAVDEAIAAHVLARKEQILALIRARSRQAFAEVKRWMAAQRNLEWVEPSGGVVCFPRIRADSGVDVDRFYRILNQKYGTFVGPGHWFEMDRRYMRIGYGWPRPDELTEGLRNIGRALDEARR